MSESIVVAALAAATLAELVHTRRVKRVRYLAFGHGGRPNRWTWLAPPLRVLGFSSFLWASLALLALDPEVVAAARVKPSKQRLVLLLDASPSMYLEDSGPEGGQTREGRARDLARELLRDVGPSRPISLVAFFDHAQPVVVDTLDRNVIANTLDRLPLHQAFTTDRGKTDLFRGLAGCFALTEGWGRASTTLVIISDGDSVPGTGMPVPPPAIGRVLVAGVGSATGRLIDGHSSAQHVGDLREIAGRLRGKYYNCDAAPPPPNVLAHLRDRAAATPPTQHRFFYTVVATMGISALGLMLLPVMLATLGTRRVPRTATREIQS